MFQVCVQTVNYALSQRRVTGLYSPFRQATYGEFVLVQEQLRNIAIAEARIAAPTYVKVCHSWIAPSLSSVSLVEEWFFPRQTLRTGLFHLCVLWTIGRTGT